MKTFTATELTNNTSDALTLAQHEPVTIEKDGHPVAVLISQTDYERFLKFEDDYWLSRAEESEKGGFIGTEATEAFFKEMLIKGNADTGTE
ncbi:MAG TPA: type II toxin-antitoxin system Phd/YefM family antitoxin [Drouetiella sp.]